MATPSQIAWATSPLVDGVGQPSAHGLLVGHETGHPVAREIPNIPGELRY